MNRYTLKKNKTQNPREIPINDTLEATFRRIKRKFGLRVADGKKQDNGFIFTFNGKPVINVKAGFRMACDRAVSQRQKQKK